MNYKEIELPDGTIAEFPDNMSDDDIASVLQQQFAPQQAPENPLGFEATPRDLVRSAASGRVDRGQANEYLKSIGTDPAIIDRFGEDATFGQKLRGALTAPAQGLAAGFADEIASRALALPALVPGGLTYEQAQQDLQRRMREDTDAFAAAAPISSVGLELAGGLTGASVAAKAAPNLVKGISNVASRGFLPAAATSGGVGAVSGGLYGAGTGEGTIQDRSGQAGEAALFSGVAGPVGLAAVKGARPLASRAANLARRTVGGSPKQAVQSSIPANISGEVLPLTQGQATQSQKLQSLENMARAGALDDAGQALIVRTEAAQQQAIKDVLSGADEQALEAAGRSLKGAYKDIRGQVSDAYDNSQIARKVFVDKKPISEVLAPKIQDIAYKQGFDTSNMSGETQKLISQVGDIAKDKNISGLNLEKMEFWRRKLTNRANQLKGDPEGVMLNKVVSEYDNFIGKLPSEAIKSGDESALKAIENARSLRRRQGVLFERDKVIKDIVKNDELTPEQLANMVLTGSQAGQKIPASAGRYVRNMKRAAGEAAPQLQENIQKGVLGRALNKSITNQLLEGTETQVISPSKLLKELNGITNNKSFTKEVFDENTLQVINGLKKDLLKITSVQPGARNYSNSAYTIINALNKVPFLGISGVPQLADLIATPLAKKSATKTLKRDIAEVLPELQKQFSGEPAFYGGAAVAPQIPQSIDKIERSNDG